MQQTFAVDGKRLILLWGVVAANIAVLGRAVGVVRPAGLCLRRQHTTAG